MDKVQKYNSFKVHIHIKILICEINHIFDKPKNHFVTLLKNLKLR
jgi:hypothetical protein